MFFLILFLSVFNINALDKTYEISIPSTYIKNDNIYTKEQGNKTTTISINVDKNDSKINIDNLTNQDLKKAKYIKSIETALKKFSKGVVINNNSINIEEINNHKLIKFDITSTSEEKYKSVVYQTQYISSSKNYVYYIVISSSNKDDLSSEEIKQIINSFTMKDEFFNHDKKLKKYYKIIGITAFLWLIVFLIIKKK